MPRRRPYDPKGPKTEGVDLGLSQLMSAIEGAEPIPRETSRDNVSTQSSEPKLEHASDEYQRLDKAGAWKDLVALTEARLREAGPGKMEQAEARVWWLHAQLELKGMPLAMLAGPLDNLAALLLSPASAENQSVAARVRARTVPLLKEAGSKLFEAGDQDLAIGLMERQLRLEGGNRAELLEAVRARLAKGAPRPKDRHGLAQYEKLRALQNELEKEAPVTQPPRIFSAEASKSTQPPKGARSFTYPGTSTRAALFGAVVVLLVLAGLVIWQFIQENPSPEKTAPVVQPMAALLVSPVETAAPAQLLPETERINRLSYLDAVLYDLKNSPARVPAPIAPLSGAPRQSSADRQAPPAPKKEKDRVDTSYPVESADMEARRKSPSPSRESQVEIEQTERDGFTPFEMARTPRDGSAEFREFTVNREYTILVRTKVMPKASVYGAPLGELERGDRIAVVAQEGYWLKIRSRHGRVGFILAQDAATERP